MTRRQGDDWLPFVSVVGLILAVFALGIVVAMLVATGAIPVG